MESRIDNIRANMSKFGIEALILTKPSNTVYASGFRALDYTRWVIAVVPAEREPFLIVPKLDEVAAREGSWINDVLAFAETPSDSSQDAKNMDSHEGGCAFFSGSYDTWPGQDPFELLVDTLRDRALEKSVLGIEEDYLPVGCHNLLKHALPEAFLRDGGRLISKMRMIKSGEEIRLLRNAAHIADIGVKASLKAAAPGVSEIILDNAGDEAIRKEATARFPQHKVQLLLCLTLSGPKTFKPHLMSSARTLEKGDVVIHARQDIVDGYTAECERTFFIGEPDKKMTDLFKASAAAQQAAIEAIKPGVAAEEADSASRKARKKAGYGSEFWAGHRTGHGIGLEWHERPYLRDGDKTTLRPGMTFAVEPGIYVPGVGGFRISDTVLVTADGCEVLTKYPRDLDSLIVEC